jgi:type IV secretory pathway ATPase VirB11/archaellum biosynthesis ATPase/succinate dehydrogenase flavin-adding protein (antitoxin of CptAB toxin-antitoxin module)
MVETLDMLKTCGAMVKHMEGKKEIVVNCRNCIYGASVSEYPQCMARTLDKLIEHPDVDSINFEEFYERIYDEKQTQMLREVAQVLGRLESERVWSPSHLGGEEGDQFLTERNNYVTNLVHNLLRTDPVAAYFNVREETAKEQERARQGSEMYRKSALPYLKTLTEIKVLLENTTLIRQANFIISKLHKVPSGRGIYRSIFEGAIKPTFIRTRLETGAPKGVELVDSYMVNDTEVEIYKHPEKIEYMYYLYPPEYSLPPDQYFLLNKTKDIVSEQKIEGVEFEDPAETRRYFERIYEGTISDLAEQNKMKLEYKEIQKLAKIVARYTVGFGLLETILADDRITDVYIDAPIGRFPIYLVHADYSQCGTNVIYTIDEARSMISKFRAISGRPFDESHPVLDMDLEILSSRICVIGKPLSPSGISLTFRRHKETPWTLPQFMDVKMINPLAAGMLSFFIDAQASTIVTGSRGSGKTSFLNALVLEIPQNLRIITQEDTLELPVDYMKKLGLNIQRLKTRSVIQASRTESEIAPEEALRTALRLGDSVLIIGEVRSKEAKVLYEAMRVGAVGNVVMGTVHGESAYSVWDRIVNDLEVPTTSFKATDLVIVCAPIRFKGSLTKYRRVIQVTEVKKHWEHDPYLENGFEDILTYSAKTDDWDLNKLYVDEKTYEATKESEIFEKIMRMRGVTFDEIWNEINVRAKTKKYIVDAKRKYEIPPLLESQYTVPIQNKFQLMAEGMRGLDKKLDYKALFDNWQKWVDERYIKPMVARKAKLEELKVQKKAAAQERATVVKVSKEQK